MTLLDVQHVQKSLSNTFWSAEVTALKGYQLLSRRRRICGSHGESGSGKTTLLNILATLDRPTDGTVL